MNKECIKCHKTKDITEFAKAKLNIDGYTGRCKTCIREDDRKYYSSQEAKNKRNEYQRARYSKQEIKAKQKEKPQTLPNRYNAYKASAKHRGYSFDLTKEQFATFWNTRCFFCNDMITGIGIDRLDNNIGYTLDNCVSCCSICNVMKSTHAIDLWFTHMEKILSNKKELVIS